MAIRPKTRKQTEQSFADFLRLGTPGAGEMRYNQGGERQSDPYPAARPAAAPRRPAQARPAPARPQTAPRAPLPPRRPSSPGDRPIYPGAPETTSTPGPTIDMPPFVPAYLPQVDPLGGVTGPPAPASSTLGVPPTWQPTDQIPPLTGPGSDRAIPAAAPSAPAPLPAPQTGPRSDRTIPPPPGLLDTLSSGVNSVQDWLRQTIPPLGSWR